MRAEIIDYDHLGRGIAKINNKIVFVEDAVVNDVLDINITKSKNKYDEAIINKIITPSPNRQTPKCPYYYSCGGCDIMSLNYQEQLRFKQQMINNIIEKYTHEHININPIIPSNQEFNYRNKITLQVHNQKIGLYARKTNKLIPIKNCLLVHESINKVIPCLKPSFETKQIIIRNGQTVSISKVNNKNQFDNIGENSITLNNVTYNVNNAMFFQVNNYIAEHIFQHILHLCQPNENTEILDLFCGCGSISLFLAQHCKQVTGIEINSQAIECANKNKELNNIKNAKFICDDVDNQKFNKKFDIVIVDPPRSGLSKKIINTISLLTKNTLIYISCNPLTLARDLDLLKEHFIIKNLTPFDMFPNTHHVECVCLLKLK